MGITKEEIIKWLEEIIKLEKNNIFGEGKCSAFGIDAQLKAADILSSLQGWKINFCRKSNGPRK